MVSLHRVLMGAILLGNALAFAGVDPVSRAVTAALVLILILDMRRSPAVPRVHTACAVALGVLIFIQLIPVPEVIRRLLQPGYVEVMPSGWAALSHAPWSTVQVAASSVVAVGIGPCVRVLSLGQSKLLLKAELRGLPTAVCFLRAKGNRLYAGDAYESVHIVKFSPADLTLTTFADDTVRACSIDALLRCGVVIRQERELCT